MSFYPTKNLGALGDAGLVTTNDPDIDKRLRRAARPRLGGEVLPQVRRLEHAARRGPRGDAAGEAAARRELARRAAQAAAQRYDKLIETANLHGFLRRPIAKPDRRHTFNQYVVRVPAPHRDSLVKHLKDNGIGVEVYYPLCLHQQECFKYLGHRTGDFPVERGGGRGRAGAADVPGDHRGAASSA